MTDVEDEQPNSLPRRILGRASRLLSRQSLRKNAEAARDHLMIEAQRATYREMHLRFVERAGRGEGGLNSAVEAMDAMWQSIRILRSGAPTVVRTMSSGDDQTQVLVDSFFHESTDLLEDAIRMVFAEDLGRLTLPPDRMAVLIRIALEGLIVELAHARTAEDVVVVDNAYADVRALFERFALAGDDDAPIEPLVLEPIPLPW